MQLLTADHTLKLNRCSACPGDLTLIFIPAERGSSKHNAQANQHERKQAENEGPVGVDADQEYRDPQQREERRNGGDCCNDVNRNAPPFTNRN